MKLFHLGGAPGYMPHGRGWCDVRFTKSRGEVDIKQFDLAFFYSGALLTHHQWGLCILDVFSDKPAGVKNWPETL
ncbi:hypothetical protein EBQ74_12385 [bacterium]|nr:hypothetical protein [bacterium]